MLLYKRKTFAHEHENMYVSALTHTGTPTHTLAKNANFYCGLKWTSADCSRKFIISADLQNFWPLFFFIFSSAVAAQLSSLSSPRRLRFGSFKRQFARCSWLDKDICCGQFAQWLPGLAANGRQNNKQHIHSPICPFDLFTQRTQAGGESCEQAVTRRRRYTQRRIS